MSDRRLRLGIIGVGVGAAEMLPAMDSMAEIDLAACADVVPQTLERFQQRYPEAKTYDSAEGLCSDPNVEAVWVSTPNQFHAEHAILAARHGKHVVVEKPMAISIEEAEMMIEAADQAGVKLLAGHTQSFTMPIRAMRRIIASGELGPLCAVHIWSYSDWMLRPRTAEELDPEKGGGLVNRQTPHQVDTVRLLGGGLLRSVRAATGQWFAPRSCPGYYTAYLEFTDGTPCTIMHNGYGYFVASELVPWGSTKVIYTAEERVQIRKGLREVALGSGRETFASERRGELDELYESVVLGKPLFHDGRWGLATLEACLAIVQSALERREITLGHQVPVPATYDAN